MLLSLAKSLFLLSALHLLPGTAASASQAPRHQHHEMPSPAGAGGASDRASSKPGLFQSNLFRRGAQAQAQAHQQEKGVAVSTQDERVAVNEPSTGSRPTMSFAGHGTSKEVVSTSASTAMVPDPRGDSHIPGVNVSLTNRSMISSFIGEPRFLDPKHLQLDSALSGVKAMLASLSGLLSFEDRQQAQAEAQVQAQAQVQVYASPKLSTLIAADVISAVGAALAVSPLVTIIDKAVVQSAGGASLGESLARGVRDLVSHPGAFLARPELKLVCAVYIATYSAANTISTVCKRLETRDDMPKFVGVSMTSITACLLKDRALARMFGHGKPRAVPLSTYSCFVARDSIGAAAAFNFPCRVAAMLEQRGCSTTAAITLSQLLTPAVMEIICTPFHFMGFNIYNQPHLSAAQRISRILSFSCLQLTLVRMIRVTPAFGIGGVVNTRLRLAQHDAVDGRPAAAQNSTLRADELRSHDMAELHEDSASHSLLQR